MHAVSVGVHVHVHVAVYTHSEVPNTFCPMQEKKVRRFTVCGTIFGGHRVYL